MVPKNGYHFGSVFGAQFSGVEFVTCSQLQFQHEKIGHQKQNQKGTRFWEPFWYQVLENISAGFASQLRPKQFQFRLPPQRHQSDQKLSEGKLPSLLQPLREFTADRVRDATENEVGKDDDDNDDEDEDEDEDEDDDADDDADDDDDDKDVDDDDDDDADAGDDDDDDCPSTQEIKSLFPRNRRVLTSLYFKCSMSRLLDAG